MMHKERLEEIKKELELDWSDISYVVNQVDVKWLINRVEELEEEVDRLNGALHYQLSQENIRNEENRKLRYKNKRYREAIESKKNEINYALHSKKSKDVKRHYLENAIKYADKALECEE